MKYQPLEKNIVPEVIAIHQPNLFPWLGFFAKIIKSDTFVFLDHVLLNSRSAIYTKRVKVIANGNEFWLTIPLKTKPNQIFQPICEMEIDKPDILKSKHLKTFELNYKKSPFFSETFPLIESFYNNPSKLIAERNSHFTISLLNTMNFNKASVLSSTLACSKTSTEMLVEIMQKLGGKTYLSGDGAEGYQDIEEYQKNNITLQFMNYVHPQYPQFNSDVFCKGLSIIDALMNVGISGTKSLLELSSN